MSLARVSHAEIVTVLDELHLRLLEARRMLAGLLCCPDSDHAELRELAQVAVSMDEMVEDLFRSIQLRANAKEFWLKSHELHVLKLAAFVDQSIEFSIRRMASPAKGLNAIH
jgi:hypothetical protein